MRSNIINLYGKWSLSLLIEHFSDFLDYYKQDLEYAQLAWTHLSPTKQDEHIQELPEETDHWRLFEPGQHTVDENSIGKLLKRHNPTLIHTEKLIMTDSIFSQTMIDPKCQIKVEDFMPNGRLSHIYIPNYVYILPMAAEIITGLRNIDTKDINILWRRMHQARGRAAILLNMVKTFEKNPDERTLYQN